MSQEKFLIAVWNRQAPSANHLTAPTKLHIRLRFFEKNTLRLVASLPLPVFVQQPQLCRPERNAAIALVEWKSYDIAIKQQTKRRLPSPFSSRCKDYSSDGVKQEFYGIASKEVICMRSSFTTISARQE
ncbi:uncharacterized protein LOC142814349 [Rhipicephalus microplus]|uniref:uncharacterized protein LOC142814349 n=1 Tax=Rhipicephalus microplus TaxID=6941 RepID=UPI003F6BFFBF